MKATGGSPKLTAHIIELPQQPIKSISYERKGQQIDSVLTRGRGDWQSKLEMNPALPRSKAGSGRGASPSAAAQQANNMSPDLMMQLYANVEDETGLGIHEQVQMDAKLRRSLMADPRQ